MASLPQRYLAFAGPELIGTGDLPRVAEAILDSEAHRSGALTLLFEADSGRQIDIDLTGSREDVLGRLEVAGDDQGEATPASRGRGRPKLGVVGREVTLLPRHWAWLATQRGGASATLRRLVDAARREGAAEERVRASQDAAQRLMTALAGDREGYEEACRALYARDQTRFLALIDDWPKDVRGEVQRLAEAAFVR